MNTLNFYKSIFCQLQIKVMNASLQVCPPCMYATTTGLLGYLSCSGWPQALKIMVLSHVYAPSSSPLRKLSLFSRLCLHAIGIKDSSSWDTLDSQSKQIITVVSVWKTLKKYGPISCFDSAAQPIKSQWQETFLFRFDCNVITRLCSFIITLEKT